LLVYILILRNAEILDINQRMCQLCVFIIVQERLKEIAPQQRSSVIYLVVIYLVSDCRDYEHQYTINNYLDLRCPESLLTNNFQVEIYVVFLLGRLTFLLFSMICNHLQTKTLNWREDLGLILLSNIYLVLFIKGRIVFSV